MSMNRMQSDIHSCTGGITARKTHPAIVCAIIRRVRFTHHHTPTRDVSTRRVQFTHHHPPAKNQHGFTVVELLISMAIGTILLLAIQGVVGRGLQTQEAVQTKNELTRQAHFAMQQMVNAVSRSNGLLLPSVENPNTAWPESVREFPPRTAFPGETAVLAVLLDHYQDLDNDGFPDADNDSDGRIDEDPGGDMTNDQAPGLFGIDDDNDGTVDEQHTQIFPGSSSIGPDDEDDDEDGYANEDLVDGIDGDGDGKFDEDIKTQTDGNDLAGVGGVDDDNDGHIDEGDENDDDEDGKVDEDWYDPVVFYLNGATLLKRIPIPLDVDGGGIKGTDVSLQPIAEHVTGFRVERIPQAGGRAVQVDLTLELTSPNTIETVSLTTRVRVGGAL